MKRYFYVVGILALLMVTMMPLASAAASGDQKFRAAAYEISGCSYDTYGTPTTCTTVGPKRGAVNFGPIYGTDSCADYDITYSASKLQPNEYYNFALMGPYSGGITTFNEDLGNVWIDDTGRGKTITNTCDNGGDRADIKEKLASGYFIGILV